MKSKLEEWANEPPLELVPSCARIQGFHHAIKIAEEFLSEYTTLDWGIPHALVETLKQYAKEEVGDNRKT